jgi:hypothetical protein
MNQSIHPQSNKQSISRSIKEKYRHERAPSKQSRTIDQSISQLITECREKKHTLAKHLQSINQSTSVTQSTNQEKLRNTRAKQSQSIHPSIPHQSTDQSIHQSKQEMQAQ